MKFSEIKTKLIEVNGDWNAVGIEVATYIPIKTKYETAEQILSNGVIEIKDGFAAINRMQNEVCVLGYTCGHYTDIEFDNDEFSDEDFDFLAMNKFKEWIRKVTKQDSFNLEQIFKNAVLDEVRRLNSATSVPDMDEVQKLVKALGDIDQNTIQALSDFDGNTTTKAIREMVDNDTSNKSSSVKAGN